MLAALAVIAQRVAEQGQVGDAAAQQDVGGPQDPLLLALGQHDVPAVGDRAVDQLVLEHQRRHGVRARDLEPVEQRVAVDVLVEERRARSRSCAASPCRAGRGTSLSAVVVACVPRSVATIGIVAPMPVDEPGDLGGQARGRR